ncbi:hypothetical protein EXIGLDRAFT_625124 [Exidia glandulosa HHB12029]|uniref:CxC6 like cysteine cluster associated with KDZ domain-containing protein n=1 Tax=Exidia glandulosa HHB12029 TaxID=1314781 RepID=A0A165D5H2_EXIGL|nr:hypothetical protein EXIGLDRAFT_625124 [Exidia glandulosa HHB12029]
MESTSPALHRSRYSSQYVLHIVQEGTSGFSPLHPGLTEELAPPTTLCLNRTCKDRRLVDRRTYPSTLFTLRRGALSATAVSLYCKGCNTRYHHDFFVRAASDPDAQRVYYPGIPTVFGAGDHFFVESALCVFFENMYMFSHASSEGIARIYNRSLAVDSEESRRLTGEVVLNAFLMHSLLRFWAQVFKDALLLPHAGTNDRRLDEALERRNIFMAGTGQAQWAHACKACTLFKRDAEGRAYRQTACVIDGVTLQHPCCSFKSADGKPCLRSLARTMDRYCPVHHGENFICVAAGCRQIRPPGFETCPLAAHRALETGRKSRGKSMNKLKERLHTASKFLSTGFTRTWTHNEQLAVRCCGVIISRATMFQAEAITGVRDFLMATFPEQEFPGSRPSFLFYDDNCALHKHIYAQDPTGRIRRFFARIGLPVDVFHFESKHKEADLVCQTHCNPASFPDLMNPNGTWAFNSSAAEQANSWIKKYKQIVREMNALRYDFFLDEMIALRNEFIVEGLQAKDLLPHIVPDEVLTSVEYLP